MSTTQEASPSQLSSLQDLEAVENFRTSHRRLRHEMAKAVVGQEAVVDEILIAIFTRSHALLVGVPGLAKTLMISTLAQTLQLGFKRIQFTPDLMPSDITGTEVIAQDPATGERAFRFLPGPLFTNILLADEINRTPPKTQAAMLEAMQGQMEQLAQASGMLDQLAAQMEQLSGQLAEGGSAMQQASQPLASAAQQAAQMSSQLSESLPAAAEQALTEASQAMAAAAQSAAQSQQAPAEAQAAAAQAALAQAQQAVAAAMAAAPGAAPGPPGAAPGPPGQAPGEGSTPAGADAPATADMANATLTTGELYGSGPDFLERLKAGDTAGRKREGAAVSEQEKRPQAYREMVDQYYRNLAEEAARSR
jgi:chemotaxis protein histidine kinase CheA